MNEGDAAVMLRAAAPKRIAIYRALFLGDLLCTVPAFRALRRRFPDAEVTLIGLPWAATFVRRFGHYLDRFVAFVGYPGINEVVVVPDQVARFFQEQHAYGYDVALQMHGDGSVSTGFVADLGARLTLGYRSGAHDGRLTASLPYDPDEHEVLRWLRLVALLGADSDDSTPEWPSTQGEERQAARLLRGICDQTPEVFKPSEVSKTAGVSGASEVFGAAPLIGLHPGAKDPARRWPPECFAALGDALAERYGARLLITGSTEEAPIAAAVKRAMRAPALDLCGKTDLGTFAAVVARLDLLVTNDTGASHVAAATTTPSVALFGPTRPGQWSPLDRARHRVVDAVALSADGLDPTAALRQLPVEPVLAVCASLLCRPRIREEEGTPDTPAERHPTGASLRPLHPR
ncbi:MAG TPA: glycosyltransferase family 9 protein [Ardenticatenaceae bacterium]|nr:glycosyltransferase family 9 protein [Ardenticatenaceae bacterium]